MKQKDNEYKVNVRPAQKDLRVGLGLGSQVGTGWPSKCFLSQQWCAW